MLLLLLRLLLLLLRRGLLLLLLEIWVARDDRRLAGGALEVRAATSSTSGQALDGRDAAHLTHG